MSPRDGQQRLERDRERREDCFDALHTWAIECQRTNPTVDAKAHWNARDPAQAKLEPQATWREHAPANAGHAQAPDGRLHQTGEESNGVHRPLAHQACKSKACFTPLIDGGEGVVRQASAVVIDWLAFQKPHQQRTNPKVDLEHHQPP